MLRCLGFEVNIYDVTLRRLAYERLRLVQNPGNTLLRVGLQWSDSDTVLV